MGIITKKAVWKPAGSVEIAGALNLYGASEAENRKPCGYKGQTP
jgi:hypothetical protein